MIDVLIKRGDLDTETRAQREGQVETECMHKPRNRQKVEERSEIHPFLEPSRGAWPCLYLDLGHLPSSIGENKFLFPTNFSSCPGKLTQLATEVSHKRGQPVWFHLHRAENRLNKITVKKKPEQGFPLGGNA